MMIEFRELEIKGVESDIFNSEFYQSERQNVASIYTTVRWHWWSAKSTPPYAL
jgi:hypothetical protein